MSVQQRAVEGQVHTSQLCTQGRWVSGSKGATVGILTFQKRTDKPGALLLEGGPLHTAPPPQHTFPTATQSLRNGTASGPVHTGHPGGATYRSFTFCPV